MMIRVRASVHLLRSILSIKSDTFLLSKGRKEFFKNKSLELDNTESLVMLNSSWPPWAAIIKASAYVRVTVRPQIRAQSIAASRLPRMMFSLMRRSQPSSQFMF